jgi:hypothetical protein
MMVESNKFFRKIIAERVHAFAYPPKGFSSRTADVIKAVKVLSAQFSCLLKVTDLKEALSDIDAEIAVNFLDADKLTQMRQRFMRFAVEEQMRRHLDEGQAENLTAILDRFLLVDAKPFIARVFERRSAEIDELMAPKNDGGNLDSFFKIATDLKK